MRADSKKRRSFLSSTPPESGFTLPEVLITIVILGVLLAIVVPAWNGLQQDRELDAAADQLASDLRLAQGEAANDLDGVRVELNPSGGDYKADSDLAVQTLEGNIALDTNLESVTFTADGRANFEPEDTDSSMASIKIIPGTGAVEDAPTIQINEQTARVSVEE